MTSLLEDNNNPDLGIDDDKNYFEELVGDNKKFKSPEDLAKAKVHSDLYISTLTKRLDEMREDYNKLHEEYKAKARLDEVVDQLNQRLAASNSDDNTNTANEGNKANIDLNQIESLISEKLQKLKASEQEEANFREVQNKLKETYGENYKAIVQREMEQLGLQESDVNELARKRPKVFMKTFGLDSAPKGDQFQPPPRSGVRSDSFSPNTQKRTWTYYQKMKRENPRLYNDPKTIVQMHNDAIALGDAFEDGDFRNI